MSGFRTFVASRSPEPISRGLANSAALRQHRRPLTKAMTDPSLPAQLAKFLGTLGTVEVIVRVTSPADNWLLDLVTPIERDRIRRRFFEEELAKLDKRLEREGGLHVRLYGDRGEASVAGQPETIYNLVRPGGVLAQHAQFEVLGRFRILTRPLPSTPLAPPPETISPPRRIESPRLPASI